MTISILAFKGKLNGKILLLRFFFVGYILKWDVRGYKLNGRVCMMCSVVVHECLNDMDDLGKDGFQLKTLEDVDVYHYQEQYK